MDACKLKLGNAVVVVEGVVAAEVVIVVAVVVTDAADEAGGTVKLKPLAKNNDDPDVAGAAVADGTVDALVAEAEANVGVGVAKDAPNGELELADKLAAAPVLENNDGADAACEVAKEKPLAGAEAGVLGAADALLENEKAEAEGALENKEGVVLAAVVLPDDGVKPNDGAGAVVAGANEKPRDGAVVAVVAGDDAAALPNSGAVEVDPNKDELVGAPNRAGAEAEVVAVLDAAGAPKPNDGVEAAAEPDADEPKPKPVAAPEKRPGADAAEETAPNMLGVLAAAVVAPKRPGVAAGEETAPKRLGVVAADEVADAPKGLGVVVAAPNMLGVVAAAEVAGAPKRGEADEVAAG